LRDDSDAAKSRFEAGYRVGEVARRIYDPEGRGVAIDPRVEGYAQALDRTRALLETRQPIFEAGFAASGCAATLILSGGTTTMMAGGEESKAA